MIFYSPKVQNQSFFLDIAFVLFVVAGLTDIVDGKVARKLNVTSKFGRMLDPLVDKVLVCGTFICFAIIGQPKLFDISDSHLRIIHWLITAIIIAREVYVTTLRQIAESRGVNFAATKSGKIKMFLQTFAIGTVVVKMAHVPTALWGSYFTTIVLLVTVAVTAFSGIRATLRTSWKQASVAISKKN
jgi:CDP-diacylglycerol--glycerol-3-phosphate 3-phosphatidyltransferase